jgi:spermidine synthase
MRQFFMAVITQEKGEIMSQTGSQKEIWYETLHASFGQYFSIEKELYRDKTEHQDLVIFENAALGRVMALDGVVQTTERDEFI